ncbi:MAG TPA: NUDIX domain-containing protein [Candidatus Saccharimonadales bacterium]|nr:NUDIX domain-containing protein [Candidatus Saccharimonadales bacterium]
MAKEIRTDLPISRFPSGWEGNLRLWVVDNIVVNESRTHILLVYRSPGEIEGDKWALPGGYVEPDETVTGAAKKETEEEGGLPQKALGNIALFRIVDNPNRRNERAQNISAVFVTVIDDETAFSQVQLQAADPDGGTNEARWWHRLDGLPEMAFDHREIIAEFTANPTVYPLDIFMSVARAN